MEYNRKCIQYFFDANKYNPNQVVEQVELERKQEFPKQEAKIEIKLNEFGVYVATLIFENSKRKFIKNLENKFKNNHKKVDRYEKFIDFYDDFFPKGINKKQKQFNYRKGNIKSTKDNQKINQYYQKLKNINKLNNQKEQTEK